MVGTPTERARHSRPTARDLQLKIQGYDVVRFTWRRVTGDPAEIAATLLRLLAGSRK
jgi:very-short-patch-repair endonuclease